MVASSSVGIVGVGEPGYRPHVESTLPELVHRAARAALDDAGVARENLDNVVACASDLDDGRAISSMMTAAPAGAYLKDFVKTTGTGVHALELATIRIESGLFDTTLVISWGKSTESDQAGSVHLEGDPFYHRQTGLGFRTGNALQAAAYVDERENAEAGAAELVEHDTRKGARNPRISGCDPIEAADVPETDLRAWPIRAGHLPADADGATALVLAKSEIVEERSFDRDPVWIQGLGRQTATYNAGNRDFDELSALATAANRAYTEASISDPSVALDAVELHGASAFHELMALNALDLTEGDAVSDVLDDGPPLADGVAVNRSGGALAANPLLGAGLARVAAAVRQVRGDGANGDQAARTAAHAMAGFTDQSHGVAVLGCDCRA